MSCSDSNDIAVYELSIPLSQTLPIFSDCQKFLENIESCGLNDVLSCHNVNLCVKMLTEKVNSVLDMLAPIKKIQMRHNYAPWMSKETKNLKRLERTVTKKLSVQMNLKIGGGLGV